MNRLDTRLSILKGKGEKALTLFLTAGFPKLHSTPSLVHVFEEAGADIIELGMPFSDPLADGPVIQESSAIALRNGMTLKRLLNEVRRIRKATEIPIVLMGYLNPILAYRPDEFFADAAQAGVDGMVLPELPLEESRRFSMDHSRNGLAQILLVTPTTPGERIRRIDEASSGFVYCVSTTGVTGGKPGAGSSACVKRIRAAVTKNPVLVGFGISSPDDARSFAQDSDGVIVGSALIRKLLAGKPDAGIARWVGRLKNAMT